MNSSTETVLAPGTRLAHYEIQAPLGSGAMGTVYRAHDTALDRSVAVKVLRSRLADEPAVVERFVREARAAARVNHPNLTHVYFVGAENGSQFFAMEYVPGATFEQEIAANGPMPLGRFVDVIVQAARGLAAAHGVGVVHRDVKPSNLMLLPDGTVKVTDFGLAKSLDGDVGASGGGMLLGTPTYMSPEQCRSRPVDARTDVYTLGLTGWFLLAGKPPYAGESLGQMIQDQLNTPLPSIRALRPELPPALERALAKLCEKDPERRPASMDAVAALFEPLRPRPLDPATFAARASAFAVDATAVLFVWSGILAAAYALLSWSGISAPKYMVGPVFAATLLVGTFGAEAWFGTTLGKWMFNLEVVRADGATPGRGALLMRFLIRFPFVVVCFAPDGDLKLGEWKWWAFAAAWTLQGISMVLAAAAFVAYRKLTLSDFVTKTRVVYRSARPQPTAPSAARSASA